VRNQGIIGEFVLSYVQNVFPRCNLYVQRYLTK